MVTIDQFYAKVTKVWEKGKVNDPEDAGGATNDGVATHFITDFANNPRGADFLRSIGIEPRFIMGFLNAKAKEKTRIFDPNLLMTFSPDQCRLILIEAFWNWNNLGNLPCPISACTAYDFCVNSGSARGLRSLQTAANALIQDQIPLVEDGILGPKSYERLGAFANFQGDYTLATVILDIRERFLRGLSNFPRFGNGWINRVNAIRVFLKEIANGRT